MVDDLQARDALMTKPNNLSDDSEAQWAQLQQRLNEIQRFTRSSAVLLKKKRERQLLPNRPRFRLWRAL
jgi:hypothetical protein